VHGSRKSAALDPKKSNTIIKVKSVFISPVPVPPAPLNVYPVECLNLFHWGKAYLIGVKLYYQPDEMIRYLCSHGMLKPEEFLPNCFTGMTMINEHPIICNKVIR